MLLGSVQKSLMKCLTDLSLILGEKEVPKVRSKLMFSKIAYFLCFSNEKIKWPLLWAQ
jgi:hypothetical protein